MTSRTVLMDLSIKFSEPAGVVNEAEPCRALYMQENLDE
jgi:hypothetical protein